MIPHALHQERYEGEWSANARHNLLHSVVCNNNTRIELNAVSIVSTLDCAVKEQQ